MCEIDPQLSFENRLGTDCHWGRVNRRSKFTEVLAFGAVLVQVGAFAQTHKRAKRDRDHWLWRTPTK